MNLVKVASLLLGTILFYGCASKPITKIKVVEVKVPVVYILERPDRPVYQGEGLPYYLNRLIGYTEKLEIIIDEHNKRSNIDEGSTASGPN